jgi:16S rRNA (adenine1518-N6/adenine1519-N6)-dimethyltransferase
VYDEPRLSGEDLERLFELAHAAFNQKRKMLRNSLQPLLGEDSESVSEVLDHAEIDPRRRPETLSLEEWIRLVKLGGY